MLLIMSRLLNMDNMKIFSKSAKKPIPENEVKFYLNSLIINSMSTESLNCMHNNIKIENDINVSSNIKTNNYEILEHETVKQELELSSEETVPEIIDVSTDSKENVTAEIKNVKQLKLTDIYNCTKVNRSTDVKRKAESKCTKPKKLRSRYEPKHHNTLYDNVENIITWIFNQEHFKCLFTKDEIDLLESFLKLPQLDYKILCLRLLTRQTKWYNLRNLCQELKLFNVDPENNIQLNEMALILNQMKFIELDCSQEPITDLLNYLTCPDLKDICKTFKLKLKSYQKESMIKSLLKCSKQQLTLSKQKSETVLRKQIVDKMSGSVQLDPKFKDLLNRIHVLYSLTNPELETINDLYNYINRARFGLNKTEEVNVNVSVPIFTDRSKFDDYIKAIELRKRYEDCFKKKDSESAHEICVQVYNDLMDLLSDEEQIEIDVKRPVHLRRFTAAWIYCKLLTTSVQYLGRFYPRAVHHWLMDLLKQEVYCVYKRGTWYMQLVTICRTHLKQVQKGAKYLLKGLSDSKVLEIDRNDLSLRASKLKRKQIPHELYKELQSKLLAPLLEVNNRTIKGNLVDNGSTGKQRLTYVRHNKDGKEYDTVEGTAINYYISEGLFRQGVHCEGQILTTLFFILFYDILYKTDVPNVFITDIQIYPLDLFTSDFYGNHKQRIDKRLNEIESEWNTNELFTFMSVIFDKGTVPDQFGNCKMYKTYVKCIGQKILAALLKRLVSDYKQFRSGMPDLFLWDETRLKCAFVEVKSEHDKLAINQIMWLNYLEKCGAQAEVCYVKCGNAKNRIIKYKEESD